MPLFMLDTDTVSFALRGIGAVGARLALQKRSELCVSAITIAELRFGANKRASRKIHRAIDGFLSGVEALPFDAAAAGRFGVVAAALSDAGEPIGQMDTLIAAHALSVGAVLERRSVLWNGIDGRSRRTRSSCFADEGEARRSRGGAAAPRRTG